MIVSRRFQITSARLFSTSTSKCGLLMNVYKKLKKSYVSEADLRKRPSELEIREKNLPPNTPILEDRIKRDLIHKFYTPDRRAGYHLPGRKGNWEDYIDDDMTLKDLVSEGSSQLKAEAKLAIKEVKDIVKCEHFRKEFTMPGDFEYFFNFSEKPTNSKAVNDLFVITSDSIWGEGYSWGSVEASPALNSGLYIFHFQYENLSISFLEDRFRQF